MSKAQSFVKRIQSDPVYFMESVLGVKELHEYQIERIIKPILKYDRVAIAATHSISKTWTMARIVLWFLTSFKNSKVLTTAPTNRQVKALLWGEIRSAYEEAPVEMGGNLLTTELKYGPEWYAIGFTPQKEAGKSREQIGSTFQGFHSEHVLIVFDEATGIPADVHKMSEGLMTSGKVVKWVQIGNPTTRSCEFFKCFGSRQWFNVHLSCFDSPNLKANDINNLDDINRELRLINEMTTDEALDYIASYKKPVTYLLNAQWVISKAWEWGVTHPLFQSKALGTFPDLDESVLVQYSDVMDAISREATLDISQGRFIGVDVARYGEDMSVITELVGNKQTAYKKLAKRSTTEVSGYVIAQVATMSLINTKILIDATGVGAGVVDTLKEHFKKDRYVDVIELHFGQTMDLDENKSRYRNLKAYMFDLLAVDLRQNLDIMDIEDYILELPTIRYNFDGQGKMLIESKDDYKKRTGKNSPDSSDSLAMANYGRHIKKTVGRFVGMQNTKSEIKIKE